jgi:hypothetical protein
MLQIHFKTDNAAFDDMPGLEIARILRALADKLESATSAANGPIHDVNGNRVGAYSFEPSEA